MNKEIERKFLVKSDEWRSAVTEKSRLKQGYLSFGPPVTVRVRLKDGKGILTVKGPAGKDGLVRDEWEKELSRSEAEDLFLLIQGHPVEKIRHKIPWKNHIIEVDEFIFPRKGLILAEIELEHPGQKLELPSWIGEEVTGRPEYYNAYMAKNG